MRHLNEYRLRQNNKITQFFYPDMEYTYNTYPSITPYCALPNFNSILQYEIEDMIDKKYKIELYKLFLKKDGLYSDDVIQRRKENFLRFDKVKRAEMIIKEREERKKEYNDHIDRCKRKNREFCFEYRPILYENSEKNENSGKNSEHSKEIKENHMNLRVEWKEKEEKKENETNLNKINKKGFEKSIISKGGVKLTLPILK